MECAVHDCDRPVDVKRVGLCRMHYMRQRRTGDVHCVRPPGAPGTARKHFMYGAWAGMVNRCHNPNNASFERYGALGVQVCDRWRFGTGRKTGFQCFLSDMGERPSGTTLDRIDPLLGYSKANCRWATPKAQRANLSAAGDARAREKGRAARRRWWGKLTDADARVIAENKDNETHAAIAKRYGVARSTVSRIISKGR